MHQMTKALEVIPLLILLQFYWIKGRSPAVTDDVKPETYLSLNFKNTLQRSVSIRSDDQSIKIKNRITVLQPLEEKSINLQFVERNQNVREIRFFGIDRETNLEVALNGQQSLPVNTSHEKYHMTVIYVKPIFINIVPIYAYNFHQFNNFGYPKLAPDGNFSLLHNKEVGLEFDGTQRLFGKMPNEDDCFVKPEMCKDGISLGLKMMFTGRALSVGSRRIPIESNSNKYYMDTEGIEVFEDSYGRFCCLVRSNFPPKEWKVYVPNLENGKWLYLWMTWHTRSGLRVYINSKLVKTNRFGRRINPRSKFSSEITFAGGAKKNIQTTHRNNNQTFTLSIMQLFGKQMSDAEVGRTMLYYWNEKRSRLLRASFEFYNYALFQAVVSIKRNVDNQRTVLMRPNTVVSIEMRSLEHEILEEEGRFSILVQVTGKDGQLLYINGTPSKLNVTMDESEENRKNFLINSKIYV